MSRDTQARSCLSGGWSGAGVGVGMLRGRGGGFLVSWFLVFMASWFLAFLLSKFLGFLFSTFQRFTEFRYGAFWQILIPYSRYPRIYWTDLRDLLAPVFPTLSKFLIPNISRFAKIIFSKMSCFSCLVRTILGSAEIKKLVLELRDTSENSQIIEMRVSGFSHKQIDKL